MDGSCYKPRDNLLFRTRVLAVWVGLLPYLLVSMMVGVNSTVLCLGADGHLAVEVVQNGTCCFSPTAVSPVDDHYFPKPTPLSQEDHCVCGPCTDIPLWTGNTGQYIIPTGNQALENQLAAVKILSPFLPAFSLSVIENKFLISSPGVNSPPIFHRTVILLI